MSRSAPQAATGEEVLRLSFVPGAVTVDGQRLAPAGSNEAAPPGVPDAEEERCQ